MKAERIAALVAVFLLARAAPALTIQEVVDLSRAGVSDGVIIAQMRADGTRYDLNADGILALRAAGVSNYVLEAMIGRSPAPIVVVRDRPVCVVERPRPIYVPSPPLYLPAPRPQFQIRVDLPLFSRPSRPDYGPRVDYHGSSRPDYHRPDYHGSSDQHGSRPGGSPRPSSHDWHHGSRPSSQGGGHGPHGGDRDRARR